MEWEPGQYVWMQEGLPCTGTLEQWAKAYENAYYSGDQGPSARVFTWDGEGDPIEHRVSVKRDGATEDDRIPYAIRVNGESARLVIDGRA